MPHSTKIPRIIIQYHIAVVLPLNHVWLFVTPWTVSHQVLSVGFPRWEYWSGLPFPFPGIEPVSPALVGGFFISEPCGKPIQYYNFILINLTIYAKWMTILEKWKWKWSHSVVSDSLWPHGLQSPRILLPWDFPGKNIGVGCHFLL